MQTLVLRAFTAFTFVPLLWFVIGVLNCNVLQILKQNQCYMEKMYRWTQCRPMTHRRWCNNASSVHVCMCVCSHMCSQVCVCLRMCVIRGFESTSVCVCERQTHCHTHSPPNQVAMWQWVAGATATGRGRWLESGAALDNAMVWCRILFMHSTQLWVTGDGPHGPHIRK